MVVVVAWCGGVGGGERTRLKGCEVGWHANRARGYPIVTYKEIHALLHIPHVPTHVVLTNH